MLPERDGVREVESQLKGYMAKLERRILIQALVVFGSRARNDHWKDSDVDLVIVSPAFQGMTRRDRIGLLLEDWMQSPALEPLGYTAEEIEVPDHLVLLDALYQGRPIRDDGVWARARGHLLRQIEEGEWTPTERGWRQRV